MSLRSPLAQVLGFGAAREGVSHWWWQRLTAVALVPLALWFLWSLSTIESLAHASVHAWLAMPLHALGVILLTSTIALHSQLGVQVVIEDYVHDHTLKVISLIASNLGHVLVGAAGLLSVLLVTLSGSA
jgi:succinate dehydrogenase / fumarate reductase membrane anchor subunit